MILAAGRGSRMGDATRSQPKCLTRLGGRTLLDWQLAALRAAGCETIGLVTGYRNELLSGLADAEFHNPRWRATNMVTSLTCANEWLSAEPVLVSYGDIVYRPEYVKELAATDAHIALTFDRSWRALWDLRFEHPLEDAESFRVDETGAVVDIGRRLPEPEDVQGQYMGLLRFSPDSWRCVTHYRESHEAETLDALDMTSLLRGLIDGGERVLGIPVDGGWCEVDRSEDLAVYEKQMNSSVPWSHDWRWPVPAQPSRWSPS